MRPCDCKNTAQVCAQMTDNADAGDFWILADGYIISLAEQKVGEAPKQQINIPRAQFNNLIDWYMRDQKKKAKRSIVR